MSPLRRLMIEDMQIRNLTLNTQRVYVAQVVRFACHFGKSPDLLGPPEIRTDLLHLTQERCLAASSVIVTVSALRFFYHTTLKRPWAVEDESPPARSALRPVRWNHSTCSCQPYRISCPPDGWFVAREGLEVADVFRHFGPAFRDQNGASLSTARRRAMFAIESCRTAALGGHVEACGDCGHQRVSYNSCRNKSCPKCQGLARAQWLADRQAELLDVPYFHIVFTLPPQIELIAFQNQTVVYDILFRAASETLRKIATDPKHLGAEIGFLGVLHTWGQSLQHHPHVHFLVPGGGIAPDGAS